MYYVSKVDASGRTYITDTEDGVEEYLTKDQIAQCIEAGLKIDGVIATTRRSGKIDVYCTPALPPSSDRARVLLSRGIDIGVTPSGEAVSLKLVHPEQYANKRIVLSDYCSRVAANMVVTDIGQAILVFDDKLLSVDKKWTRLYNPSTVDVTNVTREDMLINILYPLSTYNYEKRVIDESGADRKMKISQVCDIMKNEEIKLDRGLVFCDEYVVRYCKKAILRGIPRVDSLDVDSIDRFFMRGEDKIYIDALKAITEGRRCVSLDKFWFVRLKTFCKRCGVQNAFRALAYIIYGGKDADIQRGAIHTAKLLAKAQGWYDDNSGWSR